MLKGEGTQKPRSVAHPMATAPDFHGVLQNNTQMGGNEQSRKTRSGLKPAAEAFQVREGLELDKISRE